jgi:hypothetical protein
VESQKRAGQSQVGEGTADFADYADLEIDSSAKSVKSAVPFTSEKRTGDCPAKMRRGIASEA